MEDNYQSTMKDFLDASKNYLSKKVPETEAEKNFVLAFHALNISAKPDADKDAVVKGFAQVVSAAMDLTLDIMSRSTDATEEETQLNKATFNFVMRCHIERSARHV